VVFAVWPLSAVPGTTCNALERALLTWSSGCNFTGCEPGGVVLMLRVTVQERDDRVEFRVEGKLKGPWVIELERCWRSTSSRATGKTFGVNLDGVDFIDDKGKALLTEMAGAGVELTATESMMLSTVQQILAANSTEDTSEHSEVTNHGE